MIRVAVSTRKAFTVEIGGAQRRFWTEAAAYYAIAKSLIGAKYLAAMRAVERDSLGSTVDETGCLADMLKVSSGAIQDRAARGYALFNSVENVHAEGHGKITHAYFDSKKWTAYVRRVAKKMRALDARRGAA